MKKMKCSEYDSWALFTTLHFVRNLRMGPIS